MQRRGTIKMRVLVAYTTKNGASYKCAEMLKNRLQSFCDVDVVNLIEQTPAITGYDAVVAGGSIRMGLLNKKLRKFLRDNCAALSSLPCAVFICCGFTDNYADYVETQLPKELVCSLGTFNFGGELKPEKLHGFDRFMVKHMRSSIKFADIEDGPHDERPLPELVPENIDLLAGKIRALLG